jgi:predicted membrane channel-forming protein YqfA (hemolysin III family)
MWHNESINVWSHLAVAIFLIIFIGIIYSYDSGWKEKALDQINGVTYYLIYLI